MLYAWIGHLRPGAGSIPPEVQQLITDFLSQPLIKIRALGPLRDASGARAAMMMIFEDSSREAAQGFVDDSPLLKAGLYDKHQLYEYGDEVG